MNNVCQPQQLSSSGATQLVQMSASLPTSVQSSVQPQTTAVVSMPSVVSSVPMPMGAIAIPGGATLQAVAVQAATMAIRQGAPFMQAPLMTQMDQNSGVMGQQFITQAMLPCYQNYPAPFNFHIPQDSKEGITNNVTSMVTTMAQNLTASQQQTIINASLAQVQQQVQQQAQQQSQQQQTPIQAQQVQATQATATTAAQQQLLTTQTKMQTGPTTVSTLGLGLMTQDALTLQHSLQTPQLLIAPTSMASTGQVPVAMNVDESAPPPPKKKKKKKKKNKVPTSLTPSSSSIPDKMVTYKPSCGDSDMEAFMAYQRLCNTHLDLKAKLHLLYNSRHSCQLCHREFKGFCRLRRHLQSHADFRPYKCENCSKRFYNVSKLKRHNLVHSGLKPYKCPLCDSALSRREHLKRHMLTHSEERPYRCSGCDYSSRRLDGVHKHIKGKHPTEDAKVMYVRPQIFDLLSHDFVTQGVKGAGDSKDSQTSPVRDPLTDKDSFLQLMMGNIKFSQLFTTGTTAASNAPKPPPSENSKKKKKKKRKPSNPMQIKDKPPEETKVEPVKFGEGMSMTLPVITAPLVSIGNGLLDSQRMLFHNRSQTHTPIGESQNTGQTTNADQLTQPNTPTPQSMPQHVQNQQNNEVIYVSSQINQQMVPQMMALANVSHIKQESATPQPQDITNNGTNHPMSQQSPMPQQFNNFGTTQLLPQGQQFFHNHLGEQVQVSMQNTMPAANTASAFQSVYAGGTYEPVPSQMVPGKYFGPVTPNTMYEPDPFNGVPPGVAGIPPFFRRRIGQGCRQLNDMATTFHLKQKQPNFGGPQ